MTRNPLDIIEDDLLEAASRNSRLSRARRRRASALARLLRAHARMWILSGMVPRDERLDRPEPREVVDPRLRDLEGPLH